jgi:hypothetical protein
MKRVLQVIGGLAVLATLFAATRPASEFSLVMQLNGMPIRWQLPDGGMSGLFGAGQQCADLSSGQGTAVQTVLIVPEQTMNLCIRPDAVNQAWDGGCNAIDQDINFGVPLGAWVPQYVVLDAKANSICGVSDAGTFRAPMWRAN